MKRTPIDNTLRIKKLMNYNTSAPNNIASNSGLLYAWCAMFETKSKYADEEAQNTWKKIFIEQTKKKEVYDKIQELYDYSEHINRTTTIISLCQIILCNSLTTKEQIKELADKNTTKWMKINERNNGYRMYGKGKISKVLNAVAPVSTTTIGWLYSASRIWKTNYENPKTLLEEKISKIMKDLKELSEIIANNERGDVIYYPKHV